MKPVIKPWITPLHWAFCDKNLACGERIIIWSVKLRYFWRISNFIIAISLKLSPAEKIFARLRSCWAHYDKNLTLTKLTILAFSYILQPDTDNHLERCYTPSVRFQCFKYVIKRSKYLIGGQSKVLDSYWVRGSGENLTRLNSQKCSTSKGDKWQISCRARQ